MVNLPKYFTVQLPIANGRWQQCGNDRYMDKDVAERVYKDCGQHAACALFEIDPETGEFEQFEVNRNF